MVNAMITRSAYLGTKEVPGMSSIVVVQVREVAMEFCLQLFLPTVRQLGVDAYKILTWIVGFLAYSMRNTCAAGKIAQWRTKIPVGLLLVGTNLY